MAFHTLVVIVVGLCPAAVSFFFSLGPATAASFDCRKAKAPVEKLICGDKELNDLDIILGDIYSALRSETKSKNPQGDRALVGAQRAWLTRRETECGATTYVASSEVERATACLKDMYRQRIVELTPAPAVGTDGTRLTGKRGEFLQILMSEDDRVCGKIFGILDWMLPKIPFYARPDQDPIFIRWTQAKNLRLEDREATKWGHYYYAEFDINNDSVNELVIRGNAYTGEYLSTQYDHISVYDIGNKYEVLSGRVKYEFAVSNLARWKFRLFYSQNKNYIPVMSRTGNYAADKLPGEWRKRYTDSGPYMPFSMDGTTYWLFYMSNLEKFRRSGREYTLWGGVLRLKPDGRPDEICYFEPL